MNKKSNFTPRSIKLSPEVVEARKLAREKELHKTSEERAKEIEQRRRESRVRAMENFWKENKWEIVGTYAFIFGVIIIPIAVNSLFF